jgi:hypothetical protein
MDEHIFIAIIGALINMLLSVIVPTLLRDTKTKYLEEAKQIFNTQRELILTSSIVVGITIYLALKLSPPVADLLDISLRSPSDNVFMRTTGSPVMYVNQFPQQLRNLVNLMR